MDGYWMVVRTVPEFGGESPKPPGAVEGLRDPFGGRTLELSLELGMNPFLFSPPFGLAHVRRGTPALGPGMWGQVACLSDSWPPECLSHGPVGVRGGPGGEGISRHGTPG